MRDFFRIEGRDLIAFLVGLALFAVISFVWIAVPVSDSGSIADNVSGSLPVVRDIFGNLPDQSISKVVVALALFLTALIPGLAGSAQGRAFLPILIIGVLSVLAWGVLNFWVIAGFLNTPWYYGLVAVVLLGAWVVLVLRFVSREHDAVAAFLVRYGLAVALFITIVQILALVTPEWRSPTQGVPVLYTLTLNGLVGIFMAGVGGNMLWRERRAEMLAAAAKRR